MEFIQEYPPPPLPPTLPPPPWVSARGPPLVSSLNGVGPPPGPGHSPTGNGDEVRMRRMS
ncbi:hypothetical protein VKT23_014961 [Stygiomarasmius scandens]|uniref:Uncharacterized protein n=1 Tax=Marasmiellus scandens TaxID=2682957 RepID=A0ABR1J1Q2_9AGAR